MAAPRWTKGFRRDAFLCDSTRLPCPETRKGSRHEARCSTCSPEHTATTSSSTSSSVHPSLQRQPAPLPTLSSASCVYQAEPAPRGQYGVSILGPLSERLRLSRGSGG